MTMRAMFHSLSRTLIVRHMKVLNRRAFSKKHLLVTNLSISVSLSGLGDFLEQQYEIYSEQIPEWDKRRAVRMAISGCTIGFICHHWYQLLDKYMPERNLRNVVKKIILDQTICSPIYISIFFITLGILERKTVDEVWEEIQEKWIRLYMAEWTVWPAAQFINFYFVPLRYRIFYDSTISLGYDVYTSHVRYAKNVKYTDKDKKDKG